MKRVFMVLMMLIIAVSMMAVDVGGSTSASGMQGDEYQKIWINQKVTLDVDAFSFVANGEYNVDLEVDEKFYEYDLSGTYSISGFVFGTKIYGEKDLELRKNRSWVDFTYENFGFNITTDTLLDPEQEDWQGAEFSATYKPEPFEFTVGYLLTDVGAEIAEVAPSEPENGGVYFKAKVNY